MIIRGKLFKYKTNTNKYKAYCKKLSKKNYDDLLNQTNVQTYSGYKNANEEYYKPTGYKKL